LVRRAARNETILTGGEANGSKGSSSRVQGVGYGKDLSGYSLEDYTQIKHVMAKLD
jgi:hypothetical protein